MSLNGVGAGVGEVWHEAEPCTCSTGTVATARPSRTQTRRRCTIRTGRVSAGAPGSEGEEEVTVGTSASLGVGRRKVLTKKTRAPEIETQNSRDRQQNVTETRDPKSTMLFTFPGSQTSLRMLETLSPGKCIKVCTYAQFCIQFLGQVHRLLDKNPATVFEDPAETLENKANVGLPTSTPYFRAHVDICLSHGTNSR